jgi:hypothetical protein
MTEQGGRRAAVEAFLRDPNHLASNNGSLLGAPTDKPELYDLPAIHHRLLDVLTLLPASIFHRLAHDRNLLILASPSPRKPWAGPPHAIDPIAHGAYAVCGRNHEDRAMYELERPFGSWLIKLGRIEVELAPPQVLAGIVIHECVHVYLDHQFAAGTLDLAAMQQLENDVVVQACRLGFRRETAAFLRFYATRFPGADLIMGRMPEACAHTRWTDG